MVTVAFPTLLIATVLQSIALGDRDQDEYFNLFMKVGKVFSPLGLRDVIPAAIREIRLQVPEISQWIEENPITPENYLERGHDLLERFGPITTLQIEAGWENAVCFTM